MRMRLPFRHDSVDQLVRALPRGAIALDCGANVGDVTAKLARRCSLVVAFEPSPVAFHALQRRVGSRRNVRLVHAAVGAADGTRRLYDHESAGTDPLGASAGSSLHPSKLNVNERDWTTVTVLDLDRVVANLTSPPDLLKLDVEGTEIEILERLIDTGRLETIPNVVVEMHDDVIPELAERGAQLRERLEDSRYRHVRLDWR